MTAIVGIYCRDGVVIGTDSSATFTAGSQVRTIEQQSEKLDLIEDRLILAGTGAVGLGQRFCALVRREWDKSVPPEPANRPKAFATTPVEAGKWLSRLMIEDLSLTYKGHGSYAALLAFPLGGKPHLCEFETSDFQPELKTDRIWYCSLGSAQTITDPFLGFIRDVFWKDGPPSVSDARFAVTWTLDHAIAMNPGGVNGPVRMAVLERNAKGQFDARSLEAGELDEHRESIAAAKQRLRDFPAAQRGDVSKVEEIPRPRT